MSSTFIFYKKNDIIYIEKVKEKNYGGQILGGY